MRLERIKYTELNARQKENFNFQKLSAVLADYGFVTMRLSDDWQGADFIAHHVDGSTFLRVQLKGRLSFYKKYTGKDLWVAFHEGGSWYLYPHDELLGDVLKLTGIGSTVSWSHRGGYSFPRVPQRLQGFLSKYRISGDAHPIAR
ncbi:hypothetical protein [Anaerobaca lacustris]|uniref:PD(D/E)XK endonuclease domain-containing protein n=1 Tax=Anaerobaca lacustris TaxID=3044600 RepID=A0AAW6TW60_9BACT|nr:hypothetical protein [Sedimentisphaerales bacterium M17dextr]